MVEYKNEVKILVKFYTGHIDEMPEEEYLIGHMLRDSRLVNRTLSYSRRLKANQNRSHARNACMQTRTGSTRARMHARVSPMD